MNKAELANRIAETTGVNRRQAEHMIETFTELVTAELQRGGEVNIAGFGAFLAKTRKPRVGVNPQKPDEAIQIDAVTVAKFKPGSNLKKALKHSHVVASGTQASATPEPAAA